jgi:hypothetical protein
MHIETTDLQKKLIQALQSLAIDRPILWTELLDPEKPVESGIRIYLYGGDTIEWHPRRASPPGGRKRAPAPRINRSAPARQPTRPGYAEIRKRGRDDHQG